MGIPSDNKNQVNRTRPEPDPSASSLKAELDERNSGSRGDDKRPGDLRDAAPRGLSGEKTAGEQRTAQQDAQSGADARTPFIAVDEQRERQHPLSSTRGRGDIPNHVPNAPSRPINLQKH